MSLRSSLFVRSSSILLCAAGLLHANAKLTRVDGVLGTSVTYQMQGDPFEAWVLLPAFTVGPTPLSIIDPLDPRSLNVGMDLQFYVKFGFLNGAGQGSRTYPMPADNALVGLPLRAQALTLPGSPTLFDELSNVTSFVLQFPGQPHFTITPQSGDVDGHALTPLVDGRVLVTGGTITQPGGALLNTDEISFFDPQTQGFSHAGLLVHGRSAHSATRLTDGRVLVLGGMDQNDTVQADGEIYDPATGLSTPIAPMSTPRSQHTATLLADGRVFVAGGIATLLLTDPVTTVLSALKSTAIYNPTTNSWTAGPDLPKPRLWHAATRLNDGRVLVTGGIDITTILFVPVPAVTNDCRLYNPVTNTLAAAASFQNARALHAQVLLSNGQVALTGGTEGNILTSTVTPLASCRTYNPVANAWTNVADLGSVRARHQILQANGKLYAVGGISTFDLGSLTGTAVADIELSTEALTGWTQIGSWIYPRQQAASAVIDGGQRFFVNGTAVAGVGASVPDYSAEVFVLP